VTGVQTCALPILQCVVNEGDIGNTANQAALGGRRLI
jgi:hypothetical protein